MNQHKSDSSHNCQRSMTAFKVELDERPGHHLVRIFAGPDRDHLALCGSLTFTPAEARAFLDLLKAGATAAPDMPSVFTSELYRGLSA